MEISFGDWGVEMATCGGPAVWRGGKHPGTNGPEHWLSPTKPAMRRNVYVLVRNRAGAPRGGTCCGETVVVLGSVVDFLCPPGCAKTTASCMATLQCACHKCNAVVAWVVATSRVGWVRFIHFEQLSRNEHCAASVANNAADCKVASSRCLAARRAPKTPQPRRLGSSNEIAIRCKH